MMKKLVILFVIVVLASCGGSNEGGRRALLPSYIGKAGEILVIMEPQYWNSEAGELVRNTLQSQAGVLPQYEPMFNITQFPPEAFDKFLKPYRNILYVEIKDNIHYKDPKVQVIHEKYAKDQVLVNCFAMTESDFLDKFSSVAASVLDKINEAELDRMENYNEAFGSKDHVGLLRDKYGLKMDIMPQVKLQTKRNHFLWLHKVSAIPKDGELHDIQQGIIIYDYPYVDDSTFTKKFLLQKRDSVLKQYMPGPSEGSYMTTEYYYEPEYREFNLNGQYAVEIKGLYKMVNAFMGGPFVSVTTFDEKRGRIVTAEGFVFAPKFDKREYLREVEAAIKSISFAEADTTQKAS